MACHLTEVGGQQVKCSWGKEGVMGNTKPTTNNDTNSGASGGYSNFEQNQVDLQQSNYSVLLTFFFKRRRS